MPICYSKFSLKLCVEKQQKMQCFQLDPLFRVKHFTQNCVKNAKLPIITLTIAGLDAQPTQVI